MAKEIQPKVFAYGILQNNKSVLMFRRTEISGEEIWFFPGTEVASEEEVYEKLAVDFKKLTGLDVQVRNRLATHEDQAYYQLMPLGGQLDSSIRTTEISPDESVEDQLQLVNIKSALDLQLPPEVKKALEGLLGDEVLSFGVTNFRKKERKFGIKLDDRRKHIYIIGKTGMGKSTLQENMIISDIRAGNGLAVVDPHGDLVERVVNFIPKQRINDVVFFNPADDENPIAFNILEKVDPQYKNLIASGLVGVFKKIWADSWGPRLEYILMNTILALLEYPGSTLLGITRMLVDKKYRNKVVDRITDPIVKAFWVDEYANYNERFRTEAISPIQNKVGQFLSSATIRNIVGQSKSTIDLRKAMDDKKILLMNLAKGRIGEENSSLLGAMMITKLQLAAMSRADISEEKRNDFFLYVDEFQNFATESFAHILSEARKYRLGLIIAHQYIEQLGDEVKAAVFGNVGTMIVFRVGAEDAEFLEQEFIPYFEQTDLVNLTKFDFYIKLMIDGVTSNPFSAIGMPPATGETGNRDKVITVSRERYSNPREIVEEKILRWSGVETVYKETAKEDNIAQGGASRKVKTIKSEATGQLKRSQRDQRDAPSKRKTVEITNKPPQAISLKEAFSKEPTSFKKPKKRPSNRPGSRGSRPNRNQQRNNPRRDKRDQIIPPGRTVRID